jgi:hypothetical protein
MHCRQERKQAETSAEMPAQQNAHDLSYVLPETGEPGLPLF